MDVHKNLDFSLYYLRRRDLTDRIKQAFPTKKGMVCLFGGFESDRYKFRQESSFYYLSGLTEPSLALALDLDGKSTLFVPKCEVNREVWINAPIALTAEQAKTVGVDTITYLGEACSGYQMQAFSPLSTYNAIIASIKHVLATDGYIFTLYPGGAHGYIEQRVLLNRLCDVIPGLRDKIVDVSPLVAEMRRLKDAREIELLYQAVGLTCLAHESAASMIKAGNLESEVQASAEYVMTSAGASVAFPSIVGSGKNGAILHYTQNTAELKMGDLVVIDIGAEYGYYCADLSRTYPVSGQFTHQQKRLYNIVLEAQDYIAKQAKPGIWLNNKERPGESLHHMAVEFFKKRGLEGNFLHGIGHYLGLDVHDVGSYEQPLQEGDVITIEPGLYFGQDNLGIRIEDNYWVVNDGVVCMSDELPKTTDEIEEFMHTSMQFDDYDDEQDEIIDA